MINCVVGITLGGDYDVPANVTTTEVNGLLTGHCERCKLLELLELCVGRKELWHSGDTNVVAEGVLTLQPASEISTPPFKGTR